MYELWRKWCGTWELVRIYSTAEAAEYTMHCHRATGIEVELRYVAL